MSATVEPNWVLRGWKVWVVPTGTSNIDVYSSKIHNWNTEVRSRHTGYD